MSPFAELMTLGKPRGQRANAALIWTKFVALHAIRGIVPLVDVIQHGKRDAGKTFGGMT